MRLAVLLVLVLCVVLSAADRRRSERDDRDEQHARRDGGDRRHHHRQDDRRQHHHRDDDGDDDDSDDEDDHDGDHHHHHRFVELADADRSHWREDRGHEHRGRPDAGERNHHRKGQDNRHDAQKNGKKNGKKDGLKKSDGKRGGDSEHHQERREDRHHHGEHRQNHGGDASSKMNHSKNTKKPHHQSDPRTAERRSVQPDLPEAATESAAETPSPEPAGSSEVTPSSGAEETSLSPAAESLAAALAAEEDDTTPSAGQQDPQDVEAEPLPPPHQDVAAMARYIVHVSDWASMATVSTREPTRGMPFANVFSVCDGTRYRSTGIPYLYITDMDISVQDLRVNNSASLAMSLAQTTFCEKRGYDPEDPLCAHVILTGRVLQVDDQDPEYAFARDALFARHPEMSGWPVGHHFFVAKLDIQNIIVLDFFGGAKTVPVSEYFATNPFKVHPRRANML